MFKKIGAETILTVIIVGLMGNAWAVWNDVQALKVKEPITKEDLSELKKEMKQTREEISGLRAILNNQGLRK